MRILPTAILALATSPTMVLAGPFDLGEAQMDKVTAGQSSSFSLTFSPDLLPRDLRDLRAGADAQLLELRSMGEDAIVEVRSGRSAVAVSEAGVSSSSPGGSSETMVAVSVTRDGVTRSYSRRVASTSR